MRLMLGRLSQAAVLLLTLSFLLFGLLSSLPGDPVDLLVASNPDLRPEDVARLKKLRGLDKPFTVRWWRWLVGYHEAFSPPPAGTVPPIFAEQESLDDDGLTLRPFALRLPLPEALITHGWFVRALPPASVDDGVVTALLDAGAHVLLLVVTDGHGQEALWTVPVFVAPAQPGLGTPPGPDDPVVIDEVEPQLAGSTESARPEQRSDADLMAAAVGVHPPPAPPATVDDGDATGQHVRVADDGTVAVVSGEPLPDPDHFVCGVICVLRGDLSGLGWSWATKRPVAELLFGKPAVCGDYVVDPGEGCDDGNVVGGDGCGADCVADDHDVGVLERLDIWIAGSLTGLGRIGNTLFLTVPSLLLAMLLSLVLGTWAGLRRGTAVDVVVRGGAAFFSAAPAFFIGLLLVTVFAEWWRLLPSGGVFSPGIQHEGAWAVVVDRVRHVLLPATVLVLFWTGRFVRQVRSAVIAAATGDYVRTSRMKGASPARVVLRHILPNAAVPLVTLVGLSLPTLFGGALLTETVFAWPGLGRLQYDAILQNDSYVAVLVFLISAAMVLLGSLFADVVVVLVDPRQLQRRS